MKVLVIGGSGLIGSQVVANLTELGHEAVSASPSSGVNTITGEGLTEAVIGVDAVVDVSNSPSWADDDVLNFFTTSTRNLLEAERAAGVRNHVALSIVGADRATKVATCGPRSRRKSDRGIRISDTIVRATQFFNSSTALPNSLAQGDTVRAPHGAFQPIAAADVALAVTRAAAGEPVNGTINIAGPEKAGMDDFIRNRFAATGDARQVVTDPEAHYYGAVLDERMIVPLEGPDGEEVTIYPNPFSDWSATHLASGAH